MKQSRLWSVIFACLTSFAATATNAALISRRGGQAVYDTDLDITWIGNANLAKSDTFGLAIGGSLGTYPGDTSSVDGFIFSDGTMNWPGAKFWIDAMNASNGGTGYLGFNDWRLPITVQPDPGCSNQTADVPPQGYGTGCIGSEMGHLSNVEGISAAAPGLFSNVKSNTIFYWSGTEYTPDTSNAWNFYFGFIGEQYPDLKYINGYAWAVRSGDVIPVPAAVWLFSSGLIGLLGVASRKHRSSTIISAPGYRR